MANFYSGSEVKFGIELTAQGFSMDTDDFEVQVTTGRGTVNGNSTNTGTDGNLIIYKDSSDGKWYAILDTSPLGTGDVKVVATAHIPDSNAKDGIRNEIAVATLGRIVNP